MASATKQPLSGSTNGKAIKVAATATPGTTIHAAVSGTTDWDEIWLYAQNNHTSEVILTIEFGGTTSPDNKIVTPLAPQAGLVPIIPGLILQNLLEVKAFANVANVISVIGFINRITN